MKHLLLTTIAAVVLVGCGESQQSTPAPETKPDEPVAEVAQPTTPPKAVTANKGADPARGIKPEPLTVEAPAISLFAAADRGNIEAVKQHLAAGTAVQNKSNVGWTSPLHRAAGWGHKEIIELLIAAGADVNAKGNGNGTTPLDMADDKETADLLRKHGGKTAEEASIHTAASAGNIEAIKQQLADGTDVNEKGGQFGWTPLVFAATGGHKETIELLIANGADVNAKDMYGLTPLDRASRKTADLLRKHGGKTEEELKAEGK
jgi:ankyrin repeat protein